MRVLAIKDHVIKGRSRKLSFRADESFVVLANTLGKDELIGVHKNRRGTFPASYVRVIGDDGIVN